MPDHTLEPEPTRPLRVAVVEPYLGGSHRAWAEGYAAHSVHDVEVLGLPAVHWKWRMQGGHVTLAGKVADAVDARGGFDAVLASSMLHLPGLLGLCRRTLADAAVALYVHENQLTFPWPPDDPPDLTYAMVNWTSMLAADRVVFNSEYHRREWFDALPGFLARFPDQRHGGHVAAVSERSTVLPVGVDLHPIDGVERTRGERPLVLWNHRWEYDQDPAEFVAAIETLVAERPDVEVAVAGERPAVAPPELLRLRRVLGERLVHDGFADVDAYRRLLRRSDVVVSTARHEFFGVAVTEAVHAGAFPVLPDRLVYPERIPAELRAVCLYDGREGLLERLRWAIDEREAASRVAAGLRSVTAACDWSVVAPAYDRLLAEVAAADGRVPVSRPRAAPSAG